MKNEINEISESLSSFRKASSALSDEVFDMMDVSLAISSKLIDIIGLADFETPEIAEEVDRDVGEIVKQYEAIVKSALKKVDEYNKSLKDDYLPSIKSLSDISKRV